MRVCFPENLIVDADDFAELEVPQPPVHLFSQRRIRRRRRRHAGWLSRSQSELAGTEISSDESDSCQERSAEWVRSR